MTFSGLELSAIVRMAIVVAGSDGDFADEEKAAFAVEMVKFGVSPDSFASILATAGAIEAKDALSVIYLMDDTQKKYVAAFLAVIIVADGKILDSEVKVWTLISALCNLPKMTIAEGIEFWKNN